MVPIQLDPGRSVKQSGFEASKIAGTEPKNWWLLQNTNFVSSFQISTMSPPAAGTSWNDGNVHQGDTSDDDDVVILKQEQNVSETVREAVDLSDADEPDVARGPSQQDSRHAVQNVPRRSSRSSALKTISYEESDDEDASSKEKAKAEQRSSVEVIYSLTSFFGENRNQKLGSKVTKVHFPGSNPINLHQFSRFCDANRQKIKTINVEAINWQILKEIATRLKELEVLVISESRDQEDGEDIETLSTSSSKFTFAANSKLVKVMLHGTNEFLKNERNLRLFLSSLPRTLDHLVYTFSSLEEVDQLLTGINSSPNLKNLKLLTIQKIDSNDDEDDKEELALHRKQIQSIDNLNLTALASLELNCGIWEDVKAMDLTTLLSKFSPTLRHFTIAGNLQGVDTADKQVKFHVPKMAQLMTFNMGSVYEVQESEKFVESDDYEDDSDDSESDDSTGRRNSINGDRNGQDDDHVISLDKAGTIDIEISFSAIPTLETLSLGNSIHIDRIQPSMFPKLKTLHIGSNWTVTLQIPTSPEAFNSELHEFKFVRDLRLPDFIQDQFFMLNIRKMFPALKRITMKYPTAKCLRYFFHGMANSSLETIRLKTAFDFRGMLEDALFPKRDHPPIRDDYSLTKLLELENENNDVFQEFIRDKGIELPIWTQTTIDDDILRRRKYGIEHLTGLKKLILEHLRKRPTRIPLNNKISHKHPDQTFDQHCRIGFWRYPLHKKFLKRDIRKLQDLDLFHPDRESRQFHLPCDAKLHKTCTYTGQHGINYNENRASAYVLSSDDEGTWDFGFEDAGSSLAGSNSKKRKKKVKGDYARDRLIKKVKKDEPTDVKPRIIKDEVKQEMKAEVKQESS